MEKTCDNCSVPHNKCQRGSACTTKNYKYWVGYKIHSVEHFMNFANKDEYKHLSIGKITEQYYKEYPKELLKK